jgi:ribose transport system ATP-binding protein
MGEPLVVVEGITKSFGPFKALDDVGLVVRKGERVGLVGENGAGKSTLLSAISGVVRPDHGTIRVGGVERHFRNYHDANRAGIFRIYQELGTLPNLRAYENLFLGFDGRFRKAGVLNTSLMRRRARQALEETVRIPIRESAFVRQLPWDQRALLEIVRAVTVAKMLEIEAPVFMFDETTSSLSEDGLNEFNRIVDELKHRSGIVVISHRLEEILDETERICVMRDGRMVAQEAAAGTTETELHRLMVGRERETNYYCEDMQREASDTTLLRIRGLSVAGECEEVDLEVRAGEIVGLGGVAGSGTRSVGRAVVGAEKVQRGQVDLMGKDVTQVGIADRIREGLGYVPVDRHAEGLLLHRSLSDNVTLPILERLRRRGMVSSKLMRRRTEQMMTRFNVKAPGPDSTPARLSGGTQQKLVLSKAAVTEPNLLVLDNPTRGVDAGVKHEIYQLLRELTEEGCGILLISDDLPELIGLSNRLVLMKHGRVGQRMSADSGSKPAEHDVVAAIV